MKTHRYSDNAFSIYGFLAKAECRALITRSEEMGYEDAKIYDGVSQVAAPGMRNNARVIFDDQKLADRLFEPLLSSLPPDLDGWKPLRLNEGFRFYKYDHLQAFNWHRDLPYRPNPAEMSKLTFMVYLNDDFDGGFTDFEDFIIWPETGMAALFNHKLRHAGTAVTRGTKYVLRSDVIYFYPEAKYPCPVCGYVGLTEPPYDDHQCPTHEICLCCGTQFGYDDFNVSFDTIRQKWIEGGMAWWSDRQEQPKNWDPKRQLKSLPD